MRNLLAALVLLSGFLFSGCQTVPSNSQTQTIAHEDGVSIAQGRGSGKWQGTDLSIEYNYALERGELDLSGTVQFSDYIVIGSPTMSDFRLRVIYLDENGRVLGTGSILTDRGTFKPISFHKKFVVPASSSSISFGYDGTAIESSEDGGTTNFWHNPVY